MKRPSAAVSSWSVRGARREEGTALVATLVLGLAVATATTTLLGATEQARRTSERSRDRVVALAAAEAGVAEAMVRLMADPDFAPSAAAGRDLGDPALRGWVPLEGSASYRYTLRLEGEVIVVAQGRSGTVERAVEARLRPRGYADLHRFTDIEVIDPHVVPGTIVSACDRHRWDDPARADACPEAAYGPDEVLAGDVHTNDVLLVRGAPGFTGSVSTAWLGEGTGSGAEELWLAIADGAAPTFRHPPRHHGLLSLPANVDAIPLPGDGVCHYHGPTLLRLDGSGMRVWSPGSASPAPGAPTTSVACGAGALGGRVSVAVPPSGIVRVHRSATGCTLHPLGLAASEDRDGGYGCASGDAFVWGTYDAGLTIIAEDDAHLVWDLRAHDLGRSSDDALGIIAGRAIVLRRPVSAPVRGSAPYGRNLPVAGPGIGPFGSYPLDSPTASASAWVAPRIEANLLALGRSVRIQNPSRGQRNSGTLVVHGSVGQRYRGPFELAIPGTTLLTGYASRTEPAVARRPPPPAFPLLDDGTWTVVSWKELASDPPS